MTVEPSSGPDPAAMLATAVRAGLAPRELSPMPSTSGPTPVRRGPLAELDDVTAAAIDGCRRLRADALVLAKAGDIGAASAIVDAARTRSLAADLPEVVRLRDEAHHAGAASYVAYCAGDHALAEAILADGCAADAEAAAVHDDADATLHRWRLMLNLVRVRWRAGDVRDATARAVEILGEIAAVDDGVAGVALSELFVVEQIAEIALAACRPARRQVADGLRAHLAGPGATRADRGHCYLRALVAVHEGETAAVVADLAGLFARGPAGSRLLWRAGLDLVDELLAAGSIVLNPQLAVELARAASSRPPLPPWRRGLEPDLVSPPVTGGPRSRLDAANLHDPLPASTITGSTT